VTLAKTLAFAQPRLGLSSDGDPSIRRRGVHRERDTADHLRSRGERVVVLDNLARGQRTADWIREFFCSFYHGDVDDQAFLVQVAREHELESCSHFAALAYAGESVQES
jgi:UDP-glucose 4-epimerase